MSQPLSPLPQVLEPDTCLTCGAPAPFLERSLVTKEVQRYCRMHVPESWGWIRPSLARLMEKEYLANLGKHADA